MVRVFWLLFVWIVELFEVEECGHYFLWGRAGGRIFDFVGHAGHGTRDTARDRGHGTLPTGDKIIDIVSISRSST